MINKGEITKGFPTNYGGKPNISKQMPRQQSYVGSEDKDY